MPVALGLPGSLSHRSYAWAFQVKYLYICAILSVIPALQPPIEFNLGIVLNVIFAQQLAGALYMHEKVCLLYYWSMKYQHDCLLIS